MAGDKLTSGQLTLLEESMVIELGYGKKNISVRVPAPNLRGVLTPNEVSIELTGTEEVARAAKPDWQSAFA